MALPDAALLIRWLHVLAMAAIVGGALTLLAARGGRPALAEGYERVFWPAVGVVVLTGVGNVGRLGEAATGPWTRWGVLLQVKLALLLLLLLASGYRVGLVAAARATGIPRPRALAAAAGLTAALGVAIAALGVTLAHA